MGIPSPMNPTLAARRLAAGHIVVSEFISLQAIAPHISAGPKFALFERPPPFFTVAQ
jgi:hypothetical protein